MTSLLAFLYITMTTMTSIVSSSGFHGNSFLLVFPDLGWNPANSPNPVVRVSTRHDTNTNPVSVEVSTSDLLLHTYSLAAGVTQDVHLNTSVCLTPGLIETKALRLTASGPVTCTVDVGTNQPYLSLPSQWLGTEYYVSAPPAPSSSHTVVSILAFVAPFADTNITLTITGNFSNMGLPESALIEANTVNFTLGENETLQVQSEGETLSGAVIQSTRPVGVVCGAVMTSSEVGSGEGRVVAPLLPTSVWGRRFVVVLPPLQGAHVYVYVVGSANCSVTISNKTSRQEFDLDLSGQAGYDIMCDITCPAVHMLSTSPVSMTYYVFPRNDVTNATMSCVTPAERYNHYYRLRTSDTDSAGLHAAIVSPSELSLDGFMIHTGGNWKKLTMAAGTATDWAPLDADGTMEESSVMWGSIGNSMFNFTWIKLKTADKLYRFKHEAGKTASFGLFVYRVTESAILDIPMEMRLVKLYGACSETAAVPGDGIDNDCDGRVDEEVKDQQDNDNDGKRDEDVTDEEPTSNPPGGHVSMAGTTPGVPHTQTTQTLTSNESDGNVTNTTEETRITPSTTIKPTKRPADVSKEIIICVSVLLGVPLLIILGVAVQACVMSNKPEPVGWNRIGKPEVVPIQTLALTPGPADYHDMDGETSC